MCLGLERFYVLAPRRKQCMHDWVLLGRPYRSMIRSWARQSASPYPCIDNIHAQIGRYVYRHISWILEESEDIYVLKQIYRIFIFCIRRCLPILHSSQCEVHTYAYHKSVDAAMSTHGSWACMHINAHVFMHAACILVCHGICVQCGERVLLLRACSVGFVPLLQGGLVLSRAT